MHAVIEMEEWCEGIRITLLKPLRGLLKCGEHGTLAARVVLPGVAVFANRGKRPLQEEELVGHEREVRRIVLCIIIAPHIARCLHEAEHVAQDGSILSVILCAEGGGGIRCFL